MVEFLSATGIAGVIAVTSIFVIVFLLAEPGEEISFWGVKFRKGYRKFDIRHYRRLPKKSLLNGVLYYKYSRYMIGII